MSFGLREKMRVVFAPPRYLVPPLSGIDLSTSGVKAVRLAESLHGLILAEYAQTRLDAGAFTNGEIVDRKAVIEALVSTAAAIGVSATNTALPESKSYLFETTVPDTNGAEQRIMIEQHLDEFVPLPPSETTFDFVPVGQDANGNVIIEGVGFARRLVDETLSVFDQAGIEAQTLGEEMFAMACALLPAGDMSTVLLIDVGKTTTKISIVSRRIPRFSATIGIGGHALTLAVQKYFGVTEAEARKVKATHGIVPAPGNEEYITAMLSAAAAIRDEISRRLTYWQEKATLGGAHERVTHAILAGGNASIRGLPEYLESALQIPVVTGDVFTNLASRETWIPTLDYMESLAYATAIGLALRDHTQPYA